MVAGGFPFVLQRVLNLYCFVHVYYRVWGVAAVKCTVWLWIGMALNIWVCDSVPKIRCVPLWCVWVWYIVYICHYAYSYLASGPTQLSVASSVVKWEVTYCIIVETFEGENSHKFEILLLFDKVSPQNLEAWHLLAVPTSTISESSLHEYVIFHQFVKVFSRKRFPL